jgi:hypothetical protein
MDMILAVAAQMVLGFVIGACLGQMIDSTRNGA